MNISTKPQSLVTLEDGIYMIVITGGPCSGKTTGLAKLVALLKDRGYKVLAVPESATKFIQGGICPWELSSQVFQKQLLLDILTQEEQFLEAARAYRATGRKVVILCDRGTMDGQAYVPPGEYEQFVRELGLTFHDICEHRYHAVMHLRTAAMGAEQFYTLANNVARTESPELAREIDQRTLEAWQRHPHPRVIDNSTSFDKKIERLLAEVCAVLGDPEPVERERKFLLSAFDKTRIPGTIAESRITQDYLVSTGEEELRVRARGDGDGTSYFYTSKKRIGPGQSVEIERLISEEEYRKFLERKDPMLRTIEKQRVCFFHDNQFIEVDLFEGPDDIAGMAMAEVENLDPSVEPRFPDFVKVIEEVTGDIRFLNRSLAA